MKYPQSIENIIRMIYPHNLNKVFNSNSKITKYNRYTPEDGQKVQWPKHCDYNKHV